MAADVIYYIVALGAILALAVPLGRYMHRVFTGGPTILDPVLSPLDRLIYRLGGISPDKDMTARDFCLCLLLFNGLGVAFLYAIQRLQGHLPLNPEGFKAVPHLLALNTAVSFVTNTNWQAYAGESTMSYLTQMMALAVQNFMSAATGITVALALSRGIARHSSSSIGSFWVDLTRAVTRVLLPLSIVFAIFLMSQGVIQNLSHYKHVTTLEGVTQVLPMGPVASQESIKMLGTNGGGFFNANSAHPFENPTPLTGAAEAVAMLLIPAALTVTFGRMVGSERQGYALLVTMTLLFVIGLTGLHLSEAAGNPALSKLGVAASTAMEGKEVRFGLGGSVFFASATTAASCGAVNAMHDSLTPLGGLVPLFFMMTGEVIFGGVGAGLYGILIFVILTVFIVGLMVGRTPEYGGKKIEPFEMKMAVIAVLVPPLFLLLGSAIACVTSFGLGGLANAGPHGLSEILYAFTSAAQNNGSAFAGLSANTTFYNLALMLAMLAGRFGVIVPTVAIAGSLARKKTVPPGPGTFPTTGGTFSMLLATIIVMIGALTYLPALALGPILEHLLLHSSRLF